jgi:hypothetical protein
VEEDIIKKEAAGRLAFPVGHQPATAGYC